jgi:pimeloyl-ACP methyl ester carboxylesterase
MKLRPDSSDILVGINVPTLVIVGQNDMLSPPSEMASLHEAIAGSSFVTIADAGHVCNFDQPEAFTSAVQNFLRDRCHV